jgi:phage-related protein
MSPLDKPLVRLSGEIKTPPLSVAARREVGFLLRQVQQGISLSLPHSRPMPSIGPRCHELRIVDADQSWRVIYRVDSDEILVVEIFSKKTTATPKYLIDICKKRLRAWDKDE